MPESLPADLDEKLEIFTRNGYRIICLAYSRFEGYNHSYAIADVMRPLIENELTFLGLVFFENPVKKESPSVIKELLRVRIRPIMVTGDHLLTAVEIAFQIGLIDK